MQAMTEVNNLFILQVYLDSIPWLDENCDTYCGKERPYVYYEGDPFCVTDANEEGRWTIVDTSIGVNLIDESVTVTCKS